MMEAVKMMMYKRMQEIRGKISTGLSDRFFFFMVKAHHWKMMGSAFTEIVNERTAKSED